MTGEPLLSVVIPVYNAREFLEKCLGSIQAQDFPEGELEIVCVDDGSTDGSGEWLDRYAETHPNTRVIHKENGGECSARNAGLDAMRGKYFEFVDADDALVPHSIREIVLEADRENCAAAQFEYCTELPDGEKEPRVKERGARFYTAPMTLTGSVWRYLFLREALGKIRFDEKLHFAGDTFFSQTAALHQPKCLHCNRVAYIYNNRNPNSVMARRNFTDAAENMLRLAEDHQQYLRENTFPESRKRIETWCARAAAGHIYYRLRAGDETSPFELLREKGLWPYRKEWKLLIPHIRKNGGLKQTAANYCMFLAGFRPAWRIFQKTAVLKNR